MMHASWQGDVTPTGGRVAAWFDTTGTMTMVVDGVTFTGSDATAASGEIAYCDFAGLESDRSYQASIYLDGVLQGTRTVWTAKTSGETVVLWTSCSKPTGSDHVVRDVIDLVQPDLIFFIGDQVYHETAPNVYGVTRVNVESSLAEATATDAEAWNANRFFLRKPMFQKMAQHCPVLLQWDDHEIISDWRPVVATMSGKVPGIVDATTMMAAFENRRDIASAVTHPANPGTGYYYALDYNGLRFIVPDFISEKGDPSTDPIMSSTQQTWLLNEIDGSTPFTFVMASKSMTNGNSDGPYDYAPFGAGGLLDAYAEHLHDNQLTGVSWLCGDLHAAHVQYETNPLSKATPNAGTPVLSICPCPGLQFKSVGATAGSIRYKRQVDGCGVLTVNATRDEARFEMWTWGVSGIYPHWTGYQTSDSNALKYKRMHSNDVTAVA